MDFIFETGFKSNLTIWVVTYWKDKNSILGKELHRL